MERFEVEMETLKRKEQSQMPEMVRNRIDETYHTIVNMEMPARRRYIRRERGRGVKIALLSVLTVAVLGSTVIASGFISPALAQSLRQIPLIGSIFQNQDAGLQTAESQGFVTPVDIKDTHDGVTMKITNVIYDGVRVAMVATRESSKNFEEPLYEPIRPEGHFFSSRGIEHYYMEYQGETLPAGMSATVEKDSVLIFTDDSSYAEENAPFPDTFHLSVTLIIKGIKEPFNFNVPVVKNTSNTFYVEDPGLSKTHDNLKLTIEKIGLTPITTEVVINVKADLNLVPEKYLTTGFLNMEYELVDDQGVSMKPIGARGSSKDPKKYGIYSKTMYEPFTHIPKAITIKPYISNTKNGFKKEYIKELEITVPIETKAVGKKLNNY
ncbi:DUF4179 domain-containing protein [Paenibacillus lautus]|uniref:DUF4179 domain-containing protein n=1 Tax=Paenibacillus lautus TaxID=1401 RepID=UPI003D298935